MSIDVVVADTGPLIALARIGQMELLHVLFDRIIIPQAVWDELRQGAAEGRAGAHEIQTATWVDVRTADPIASAAYELLVDRGEAEAIALASALPSALLLIDDRRGRRVAKERGLRFKGTLGVLLLAKRRRAIAEIRPMVESLQRVGVYLSSDVVDKILHEAGE